MLQTVIAITLGSLLVALTPASTLATTCVTNGSHWYGRATSGYPAKGTQLIHSLPYDSNGNPHWHVDQAGGGAFNEAAWSTTTPTRAKRSKEGTSAAGGRTAVGGWFSGLRPYGTLDNGVFGFRGSSNLLNATITIQAVSGGWVLAVARFTFTYTVNNGVNMGQGEVTISKKSWMDDGDGVHPFYASYTQDGSHWYQWGYHNDCNNAPYWVQSVNSYTYKNGGFGG